MAPESLRESQAQFFDTNPPLNPWPQLLRDYGLRRLYKPREAFWAQALKELELNENTSVLDLGCGEGIWLERLAQEYGVRGTGIDVSGASLVTAQSETEHHCSFALSDGYRLPFGDNSFDCVLSFDTLEHVSDHSGFLREMQRVLKTQGHLFLWSINRRQEYTWNWLLDRVGVDVFDRVAHDPEIIPDPSIVVGTIENAKVSVRKLEYFNSFFTLALDELIMVMVSFFSRIGLFTPDGGIRDAFGRGFLTASHAITGLLWRALNALDRPWQVRGLSNGFLVLATKAADSKEIASFDQINNIRLIETPIASAIDRSGGVGGSLSYD